MQSSFSRRAVEQFTSDCTYSTLYLVVYVFFWQVCNCIFVLFFVSCVLYNKHSVDFLFRVLQFLLSAYRLIIRIYTLSLKIAHCLTMPRALLASSFSCELCILNIVKSISSSQNFHSQILSFLCHPTENHILYRQ